MKNSIIKKYDEYITEKISDKLSGFNEVEIKQNFIDGKITINKYKQICKEHNIELPSDDEIFENIVHHSLNINAVLVYASENNHTDGIKYAIEHGADIHYFNEIALYNLYRYNNLEIFKYLLEQHYDVKTISKNILYTIIINDRYEILKILIKKGVDVNTTFNGSQTLLTTATMINKFDIIKLLVDEGADIHYDDDKALFYSASGDDYDSSKYLLEHGAIVHENIFDFVESFKIKKLLKEYYKKQTGKDFDEYEKYVKHNEDIDLSKFGYSKEQIIKEISDVYTIDKSEKTIDKYLKTIDKLNEKGGILYRIIYLESARDFKMSNLKDFSWFTDIETADLYNENINNVYKPFIITAEISKNMIDIKKSIQNFIEHPKEAKLILIKQPYMFNCKKYIKE